MGRKKTGSIFNCQGCGKGVYRSLGDQRKCKSGKYYCSKSCVRDIVLRSWVSGQAPAAVRRYARQMANEALARGDIAHLPCNRCESQGPCDMHHPDYSKPLDVEFLCHTCHDAEHRDLRVKMNKDRSFHGDCECGKKARVRLGKYGAGADSQTGVCKTCYSRAKLKHAPDCNAPDCTLPAKSRGQCQKHRKTHPELANPRIRPGPSPKSS